MSSPRRAEIVLIEGPDAVAFAHAQFASNVASLANGHWQFGAWLSAQGRVRALFHLARNTDQQLCLLLRGGQAEAMVQALDRFRFRAKVTLSARADLGLAAGPSMPLHETRVEHAGIAIGCGDHSLRLVDVAEADSRWHLAQIRHGWAWLPEDGLDRWLPSALSLQRLQAVVTDKGCYPGQEIVARMHFRGGHKRHLHRFELAQSVSPGDVLRRDGVEVGCVLDAVFVDARHEALAVLADDGIGDAIEGSLAHFDNSLRVQLLQSWPA